MNDQVQVTPAPLVDQVVTREQAPAEMERLRADRINGKVGEEFFFRRSDYLHSIMAAQPGATPPAPPRQHVPVEEQLEQAYAENMRPPDHAGRYSLSLPEQKHFTQQESEAFDTGIRNALHRGHVPQHLAAPLVEGIAKTLNELGTDEAARQSSLSSSESKLREMWGKEYDARLGRVNDLLAEMSEGDEFVGRLIDSAPWIAHANPAVMHYLDVVAQHRARARAR